MLSLQSSIVSLHMELQSFMMFEGTSTKLTNMGTNSTVNSFMSRQFGFEDEFHWTEFTMEFCFLFLVVDVSRSR